MLDLSSMLIKIGVAFNEVFVLCRDFLFRSNFNFQGCVLNTKNFKTDCGFGTST